MSEAVRDGNHVPGALGQSSTDSSVTLPFKIDSATGRLLVDTASGSGTVTSVSVVSANGFAGTVATATTTPAITLSTTVNSPILAGNGTAISAATTTGSGSTAVLATGPTFPTTITVGAAAGTTGSILLKGTTSGTVTVTVAAAAGTWSLTLPTTDGDSGQFLQTNGAGVTTWAAATAAPGGNTTEVQYNNAGALGGITGATTNGTTLTLVAPVLGTPASGTLTNCTGLPTILVANEGTDATCFVSFFTAATGELGPKTNVALTFNSSTGALGATSFVGNLTGNADTVTVANEATDTTCFVNFTTAASGSLAIKTNANMTFNSNTGVVTFASSVLTTTDINGGTIDGATIGASSATTIVGTTITANTGFLPDADGGAYLGQGTQAFSGLFLDTTATINFDNGNVVLTHSAAVLTVSTGDLRVTTAGTNAASVVTVGGTQTLTAKTLTSPAITTATLSGAQQLAEGASIRLDQTLSADGTFTGTTIAGTAGATLAFGDLVYLAVADSRWELVDADSVTTAGAVLTGFCVLAAAADGDPTVILLDGNIRADTAFPALTVGAPVYASTTAGDIQVAQPSGTDDVIHVVGFALTADSIVVRISPDYITHT